MSKGYFSCRYEWGLRRGLGLHTGLGENLDKTQRKPASVKSKRAPVLLLRHSSNPKPGSTYLNLGRAPRISGR